MNGPRISVRVPPWQPQMDGDAEAAYEREVAKQSCTKQPPTPWDRLLPRERDAVIGRIERLVGERICEAVAVWPGRVPENVIDPTIDALRVAVDVLRRSRDA